MQAASQDVRNLSRFASDAAAMPANALPDDGMRMQSSSSVDSQLPDNAELQAWRAAALTAGGSSGHSPSFRASRMGPVRELSSGQLSRDAGSEGRPSLASEMASMAVDQQVICCLKFNLHILLCRFVP